MKLDGFLHRLHQNLLQTRQTVLEAASGNDLETCLEAIVANHKEIEQLFEIQEKQVQRGALPPLPELTPFVLAYKQSYIDYFTPDMAIKFLHSIPHHLSFKQDNLRYLFEVCDNLEACNCLILARLWPTRIPPQQKRLHRTDGFEGGVDYSYVDYICGNCDTKWRLEEGATEDVISSKWIWLESDSEKINPFDYDSYGKALAESQSKVGLTIITLRETLDENLPIAGTDDENYRVVLKSLAESGIVDVESLQNLIASHLKEVLANESLSESPKQKLQSQLAYNILHQFLEQRAEKWLIDLR